MNRNLLTWTAAVFAGILLLILTSVSKPQVVNDDQSDPNTVNLALREIADQLLKQNNNYHTLIPPIRREKDGSYLILLRNKVEYFHLRSSVDRILNRHQIRQDYRLSLLDCTNGEVVLGFLAYASDEEEEFPCQDREQTVECLNLRLSLIKPRTILAQDKLPVSPKGIKWLLIGLTICFPLAWLALRKKPSSFNAIEAAEKPGWIQPTTLTAFHQPNQLLQINSHSHSLTFREAKLLGYFLNHPDQVLERDKILEAVWEDEGIIVGRSLDVFVSRLRKKLKGDPGLNIVNVHGVGYKLETKIEQ